MTKGNNELHLTYVPGRVQSLNALEGHQQLDMTSLNVRFDPPGAPPLHLVILMASDSPAHSVTPNANSASSAATKTTSARSKPFSTPFPANFKHSDKLNGFMGKALDKLRDLNLDGGVGAPYAVDDADRAIVDAPPGPHRDSFKRGGVDEVARRFALQAYMWQAFTAEQMRRHGLGRRAFNLDDSAADNTSSVRLEEGARVHRL